MLSVDATPSLADSNQPSQAEIEAWLVRQIAELADAPAETIDVREPFDSFGLASRDAVSLSGDLEEWLGRTLSPTLIYEHPTIEALARHLAGIPDAPPPVVRPATAPAAAGEPGGEQIAIVGLGCRFPGADGPDAFWALLRDGVDAVREAPADRWDLGELYDPRPGRPGKLATRWGGFLEQIDRFDAPFFGISPREAARMDPQQRLLLEVTWETLEQAGLRPARLAGSRTGVFVGISSSDYAMLQYGDRAAVDAYAGTGNAASIAANRISYQLDLRGPSIAVDTACSSSLVAVHLAVRSLRSGESDLALAAGVNVMATPELTITFSHARMMAADGRCKTFDAAADGYVRGEGCGVILLKRLSDAVRDGDQILGLVRGSAVNQDGRSNGLTAPNGLAQQAVIRAALADAGLAPAQVGYVEAHGTGTALGDPIEVRALGELFAGRPASEPVAIGSVKTNIGHLEAAAGIAGLIKAVLALRHEQLPPHLHLRELNPHIPLASLPLTIPTALTPWPRGERRRIAGVSSFGFGGANAHVLIEEAPAQPEALAAPAVERPRHLLALAANDQEALRALAGRYAARLAQTPAPAIADLAYSANTGREQLPVRLAVAAGDATELAERLNAVAHGATALRRSAGGARPKIAFLFTGQGAQYTGMGRGLYETQPVFREALDRCADLADGLLDRPLRELIFAGGPLLDQTGYTQPALFALEYALAQLWMSWGVRPDAVLGHSLGEYVAACVAGVLSLEDALRLVVRRGELMQSLPAGGMMAAVFADVATVRELLPAVTQPLVAREQHGAELLVDEPEELAIAAVNGPRSTVIAGRAELVEAALQRLADEGISGRPLATSHAFHSALMEPILDAFEETARGLPFAPPQIPLVSNLTGAALAPGATQDARYWRRHLREPVQFYAGMQRLRALGCTLFVEIGPQPHLTAMGRRCLDESDLAWLPSLQAGQDDWAALLDSLGALYERGVTPDWAAFDAPYTRRRLDLPTYPFQRERHWLDVAPPAPALQARGPQLHPLLGQQIESPLAVLQFAARFGGAGAAEPLGEQALTELVELAARAGFGPGTRSAVELALHAPLRTSGAAGSLQTLLMPGEPGVARFEIHSRRDGDRGWTLHAAGSLTYVVAEEPAAAPEPREAEQPALQVAELGAAALAAMAPEERRLFLAQLLRSHMAAVLRVEPGRIGLDQPLLGLGLDSIMAIELKAAVEARLGIAVPIAALLTGPSLAELAATLVDHAPLELPQKPAAEAEQPNAFPLSYGQLAMWFQHRVAPDSVFNPVYAARLRAPLDVSALRAAFQRVLDRHPALRTSFELRDGEPLQLVHEDVAVSLRHESAHGLPADEAERRLNAFAAQPFDLEAGPLFRVYVLSVGPEDHLLAMASHHLVTDLWSQAIIISEVGRLYAAPGATLGRPGMHYAEHVLRQRELLDGPAGGELWAYWSRQLAGELPLLNLPTARPRPPVQTHNGDRRTAALGAELTQRLRAVSEELGVTLYTTLLAAFNVLLYRYSGQSDLIVGTAAAGRSHAAATDVVGYFVNSLPIRANLAGSPTFGALVAQLKRTVSDAIAHQEYPLALLVERLRVPRDLSRTPLFQVMFVYQRAHLLHGEGLSGFAVGATGEAMRLGPLQLEPVALDTRGAPFDLNLLMAEAANGLQAELTYNSDLFDGATIERMLEHYVALLEGVSANAAQPIDRLPLLPEAERELVVERFNQTAAALPIAQPIDALFEAQVARTPGAVALVAMGAPGADGAPVVQETLSYAELDARANRLAQQLRALGVRPGRLVAVSLERSAELVVAVLGVLKAGGAYLPVDPDYPAERIAFMLGDARPVVLVSDTATAARIGVSAGAPEGPQLLLLDAAADAASEGTAPERLAGADDLAYVIYTSGSTGRPKGVLIEHRGLCNLVLAQIEGFGLTPASRTLQFASFSFDASVSEIFTALVSGGRLYLAGRETLLSSTALPRLIREEGITTVTLPPSLLAVLQPDELPGLQTVVSAGEALSVDLARRWSAGRRVINAYGPTEATIGPTMFDTAGLAPDAAVVPIGRPIANMQIYILDQLGQPLPVGVAGEICIGGVGLARGYLNRPELTAEKFVPCDLGDGERRRIYRTGDLGRFRADGTIECLGRLDQQVKIRGLRIELGEVEAQLRAHPAVREACVAAREDRPGDRRLVAYLVTGAPLEELIPVLRAHLLERLPEFMLPSAFVQLEALPLTPNGKVNQRALPAPASRQRGSAAAAPQSELERAVARIWGEALGVEGVGLHDNFFELGGHSLLMVKVHGQLQELVGRELSIVELFRYPTIATLAGHLSQAGGQGRAVQAQSAERAAQQRAALQQQQLRMQAAAQLRRGPNRRG